MSDANSWIDQNAETFKSRGVSVLVMFSYMMDRLADNMVINVLTSLILISGTLMIGLKNIRLGLVSMVPNILPILIVFGIWAYFGNTLDFSSVLIFSMTLGIIVDDTVHMCTKYIELVREKNHSASEAVTETLAYMSPAIIVNTLVLSLGFSVFAFSVFHMNVTLGVLSALVFAVGLVLELLMMPILLRRFVGVRIERSRQKVMAREAMSDLETTPRGLLDT